MGINSDLQTAMATFKTAITASLSSKAATAKTADNALLLNGSTATQIIATANDYSNTHANNTSNPHGTTASQIGAYSKTEITNKLAGFIPVGILPVSAWCKTGTTPSMSTTAAGVVTIAGTNPVILSGSYYTPAQFSVQLVSGTRLYFYVVSVDGVCQYTTNTSQLAESATCMYIGSALWNGSAVTLTDFIAVCRLDVYRPSTTARGSAIPVSDGVPSVTGSLNWS